MSKEKKYKVVYTRKECIGAAACTAVAPKFWEIVADGKADLLGSVSKENNDVQELEIDEEDLEVMKSAAEACPVTIIHITEKKTGKKVI